MLTGIALAHRTSDMLTANVLPKPAVRVIDPGFTPLFDGTASSFNSWKSADAKNGQGFALIDGEIATYGSADFALLYLATKAFADFHLRLQFKCFDPNNNNSACSCASAIRACAFPRASHHEPTQIKSAEIQRGAPSSPALKFKSTTMRAGCE